MDMKLVIAAAVAATGVALLAGCTTMTKDQCLAGAWGEKGYQDGLSGYRTSRMDDHAQACAKFGVAANPTAYLSAREDGLRTYCTWESGFRQGRQGNSYGGVCSPAEEASFLPAYQDGRQIYVAEQAVASIESALNSAISRIEDREDKLEAKQRELRQEGLTDEQRQRIREVRGEIQDARRDARRAEEELRYAEIEARAVRAAIGGRYGVW
jgi:outer membrane murein-binding lipoprotein Lpp